MDFSLVTQLIWLGYYASLLLLSVAGVYVLAAVRQRHWIGAKQRLAYFAALLVATGAAYSFLLTYALIVRAPGAATAAAAAAELAEWVRQTARQQLGLALVIWLALVGASWLLQRLTAGRANRQQLLVLGALLLAILLGGIVLGGLNGYYGLLEEYQRNQP